MKRTALIVDDERLARAALARLLGERDDVEVVAQAQSVADAAEALNRLEPDLVFLDVQMPGGSGFELFERTQVGADVIFVTAYDEHALRAFEVNALDYLVKPVSPDDIERALSRLAPTGQPQVPAPDGRQPPLSLDDVVCLHEGPSMKFVAVKDICFIRAADDYTEAISTQGRTVLTNASLRTWEERLPTHAFARIHRSTMVNLLHVEDVVQEASSWLVHLRGQPQPLTMSRRYAQALKKRLGVGR